MMSGLPPIPRPEERDQWCPDCDEELCDNCREMKEAADEDRAVEAWLARQERLAEERMERMDREW